MKSIKRTNKKSEKGAALVEFALVMPVVFLFLSASLEFGNILSQLTWVAQAGYHIAAVGAESPQSLGLSLMESRLSQLKQAKDFERFRGRLEVVGISPSGSSLYDNDSSIRTVSVKLRARILPISNLSFGIPVDISVTAPQLVENSNYNPDYSSFGAPQPNYFNCAYAAAGTSPNDTPCLTSCSGPQGAETCA